MIGLQIPVAYLLSTLVRDIFYIFSYHLNNKFGLLFPPCSFKMGKRFGLETAKICEDEDRVFGLWKTLKLIYRSLKTIFRFHDIVNHFTSINYKCNDNNVKKGWIFGCIMEVALIL